MIIRLLLSAFFKSKFDVNIPFEYGVSTAERKKIY
jgi:hypothetical protein